MSIYEHTCIMFVLDHPFHPHHPRHPPQAHPVSCRNHAVMKEDFTNVSKAEYLVLSI